MKPDQDAPGAVTHTPEPWEVAFGENRHRKGAYGGGPGSDCDPAKCQPLRVEHSTDGSGRWIGVTEMHVTRGSVADIIDANGEHVVCFGHDYDDYGHVDADNAERIVACVNSCAPFADPQAGITALIEALKEAKAGMQLAMLTTEQLEDVDDHAVIKDCYQRVVAALALVRQP